MNRDDVLARIKIDPNVCFGKPCIRGPPHLGLSGPRFPGERLVNPGNPRKLPRPRRGRHPGLHRLRCRDVARAVRRDRGLSVPQRKTPKTTVPDPDYGGLVAAIGVLIEQSRRYVATAVNGIITSAYWVVGLQIVEYEQGGIARAVYREALINRLAKDLTARYGRGYSPRNLRQMRTFYLGWRVAAASTGRFDARAVRATTDGKPDFEIWQTPSAKFPFASLDVQDDSNDIAKGDQFATWSMSENPRSCSSGFGLNLVRFPFFRR